MFEYLYLVLWRNLAQDLQHAMRLDAYEHVQRLDLAYFEDRSTGNLVTILNDDVNQLERFLNGGANDLIQVATTIVSVGAVFFVISPKIAAIAFTPIPLIVLGAFYFQRRAQPLYAEVRERGRGSRRTTVRQRLRHHHHQELRDRGLRGGASTPGQRRLPATRTAGPSRSAPRSSR